MFDTPGLKSYKLEEKWTIKMQPVFSESRIFSLAGFWVEFSERLESFSFVWSLEVEKPEFICPLKKSV